MSFPEIVLGKKPGNLIYFARFSQIYPASCPSRVLLFHELWLKLLALTHGNAIKLSSNGHTTE